MRINLHNYPAWFLDYAEGNLSDADKKELFLFLGQNPHLKEELEEFELLHVESSPDEMQGKESYKKADYTDEDIITYIENELDAEQKKQVEKLAMENVSFKHELDLYKATIFKPDMQLVYENKQALKKRPVIILWKNEPSYYFRAAAALLLLLGMSLVWSEYMSDSSVKQEALSQNNSPVQKEEKINRKTINDNVPVADNANETHKSNVPHKKIKTVVKKLLAEKADSSKTESHIAIMRDSSIVKPFMADNYKDESSDVTKNNSYHNYREDEEIDVHAVQNIKQQEAEKTHKLVFAFVMKLAKGAKKAGIKNIRINEGSREDKISFGGLAFSETAKN